MGTLPKDCAFLGGNGNILKIKTTAKLNSKQTSIAAVRDIYRMYATFLTPLGSYYRLPLRGIYLDLLNKNWPGTSLIGNFFFVVNRLRELPVEREQPAGVRHWREAEGKVRHRVPAHEEPCLRWKPFHRVSVCSFRVCQTVPNLRMSRHVKINSPRYFILVLTLWRYTLQLPCLR